MDIFVPFICKAESYIHSSPKTVQNVYVYYASWTLCTTSIFAYFHLIFVAMFKIPRKFPCYVDLCSAAANIIYFVANIRFCPKFILRSKMYENEVRGKREKIFVLKVTQTQAEYNLFSSICLRISVIDCNFFQYFIFKLIKKKEWNSTVDRFFQPHSAN